MRLNNAYIVVKRNPLKIKVGTRLDLTEDGFEQVIMAPDLDTGRQRAMGYEGLIIPPKEISPYIIQIKHEGVDDSAFIPGGNKRTRTYTE